MGEQLSQSAYQGSEASRSTYVPNANNYLVQAQPDTVSSDYLHITPYWQHDTANEHDRELSIVSDTYIEMGGESAELLGDARFVFNALIAARYDQLSAREILNYGDGFRGQTYSLVSAASITLSRAVQALDAWSIDVSGDLMVDRTGWGTGSHPSFFIARDIVIRDLRIIRSKDNDV